MINKTWTVWSVLGAVLLGSMALMGCGTSDDADTTDAESDELVIYTGRSLALVDPLVYMYRDQTDG